ncbi:MAG: hypothetical protein CFH19_00037 [Alphaproteobacteria bacterium MarineAlpha5_Bin9]|nr:MAG: hypothetical protein CFH19_00037 [Alphaproteobacteria bacterium MarineAlpha5_Bin9]|tara:strand:+ start:2585 stop:2959 length:375 start_codon:yes stop_codon:yes gene_type:complete
MNNIRPLSPHITIHKWILTQIMSISHRATGIGFSIGLLFIALWMTSFVLGPNYYEFFKLIFYNIFGKIIFIVIVFCFIFHFIDEFRKIFWAFGLGLSLISIKISSYIIILISLILTFLVFIFLL